MFLSKLKHLARRGLVSSQGWKRWKWVEKPKVLEAIDTFSTEMTFEKSLE